MKNMKYLYTDKIIRLFLLHEVSEEKGIRGGHLFAGQWSLSGQKGWQVKW